MEMPRKRATMMRAVCSGVLDFDATLRAFGLEDLGNSPDVLLLEFVHPCPGGGVAQRIQMELEVEGTHVGSGPALLR